MKRTPSASLLLLSLILISSVACTGTDPSAQAAAPELFAENPAGARTEAVRRTELQRLYPDVPRDEIVGNAPVQTELVTELQARYRQQLESLRAQVADAGARLVLVHLTPEGESPAQKALEPFISGTADELGIEYVNLSSRLNGRDPNVITQMPRDGHWSAAGASLVAGWFGEILVRHADIRPGAARFDRTRPSRFGDLTANQDTILDGGKNLPYRLQTNRQGLRLDHDLAFPKSRPRILILGDSQIYCPFLDNPATIPSQLQALHPEVEVVSAANLGYGVDDLDGLFRERARFMEPDLVIVQTGGGDILDTFFSHRNLFSRTLGAFEPTPVELRFLETRVTTAGQRP